MKALLICTVLATLFHLPAATDPFRGHWSWNSKKSPQPTITYGAKDLGNNRFALTGSTGDTVTVKADGILMPSPLGGTVSLKKLNEHKWEMVRNDHGKLNRTYTVSADERQLELRDVFTLEDGSNTTTTTTYSRTVLGKGLMGEWESISSIDDSVSKSASEVDIKPFGENGLIFSSQAQKRPFHVTFDGKAYNDVDQDPEAQKGSTTSARRINSHTIQTISLIDGKPDGTAEYILSDDEKTLTMIFKAAKSGAVFTNVFDRR